MLFITLIGSERGKERPYRDYSSPPVADPHEVLPGKTSEPGSKEPESFIPLPAV